MSIPIGPHTGNARHFLFYFFMYRIAACVSRRVARDAVRNFNISIFQGCCKRLSPASIYIGAAGGICRGGSEKNILYNKEVCRGCGHDAPSGKPRSMRGEKAGGCPEVYPGGGGDITL